MKLSLSLSVLMIACFCLVAHAGPTVTLKRHTHKKASRLENITPPPVLVTETLEEAQQEKEVKNTTELSQRFEQINESLRSVLVTVEERILELQQIIKKSQEQPQN